MVDMCPYCGCDHVSTCECDMFRVLHVLFEDDQNDAPRFDLDDYPFFKDYYNMTVGTLVGSISATDDDTTSGFGNLFYTVTSTGSSDYFHIDELNGDIIIIQDLPPWMAGTCSTTYI
jgi:hypothetical protein